MLKEEEQQIKLLVKPIKSGKDERVMTEIALYLCFTEALQRVGQEEAFVLH